MDSVLFDAYLGSSESQKPKFTKTDSEAEEQKFEYFCFGDNGNGISENENRGEFMVRDMGPQASLAPPYSKFLKLIFIPVTTEENEIHTTEADFMRILGLIDLPTQEQFFSQFPMMQTHQFKIPRENGESVFHCKGAITISYSCTLSYRYCEANKSIIGVCLDDQDRWKALCKNLECLQSLLGNSLLPIVAMAQMGANEFFKDAERAEKGYYAAKTSQKLLERENNIPRLQTMVLGCQKKALDQQLPAHEAALRTQEAALNQQVGLTPPLTSSQHQLSDQETQEGIISKQKAASEEQEKAIRQQALVSYGDQLSEEAIKKILDPTKALDLEDTTLDNQRLALKFQLEIADILKAALELHKQNKDENKDDLFQPDRLAAHEESVSYLDGVVECGNLQAESMKNVLQFIRKFDACWPYAPILDAIESANEGHRLLCRRIHNRCEALHSRFVEIFQFEIAQRAMESSESQAVATKAAEKTLENMKQILNETQVQTKNTNTTLDKTKTTLDNTKTTLENTKTTLNSMETILSQTKIQTTNIHDLIDKADRASALVTAVTIVTFLFLPPGTFATIFAYTESPVVVYIASLVPTMAILLLVTIVLYTTTHSKGSKGSQEQIPSSSEGSQEAIQNRSEGSQRQIQSPSDSLGTMAPDIMC